MGLSSLLPGAVMTASLFSGVAPSLAQNSLPAAGIFCKPNVLFIAIDDLNDWVGCLGGHPQALTPNMDRLAKRGVVFTNAQVQAPLCNPSRSSVLTGMRPSSTGIYGLAPGLRAVEVTKNCVSIPQYFRKQVYFTAGFGKVFHDGSIPQELQKDEFDVWGPAPGIPMPNEKFVKTPSPMKLVDWGIFPEDDRDQADWKTADNAIAQLKSRPKDRPFFLAAGFRLPHVPCFASQKWFDLFPPENQIKLPAYLPNDRDDVPFFSWYLHWQLPEMRLSWLKEAKQWQNLVRSYLASTTFMDSQIGRLLDALDESGEASNTIIVLWSDNGWHLGEKDITGKNSLWKPSTRVPLILAGPGVNARGRCSQPAELLDIYPTLVDLCGFPVKPELEGHSLKPQLKNVKAKRLWPAITTHNQNNHSIVTDQWRFIQYADGSQELYDDLKDPDEWKNLAADPKYKKVIGELKKWLPNKNLPLAPGSANRILEQKDGVWYWEGKPIKREDLED
jgi:arylsulfatase A-like enzyme